MGQIKNALVRYRVIDKCIRNKYNPFPSKSFLRKACEEALFGDDEGENICDSTIEKDLFFLRMEHDAPIKYSKKNRGYFYDSDSFSLDEIPLTDDDMDAIRFAANTLLQFKDVEMFKQFGFAIDKIVDRVAISESNSPSDADTFVQFESAISNEGNEYLTPLLTGIRQKKYAYFDYGSFASEKKKSRKVVPLLLKEYRNRWYLISFDCIKEAISTFALDRMENVHISDVIHNEVISFDINRFFQHAIGITVTNSFPDTIIFKADNITSKYINSQPIHVSQSILKTGKNKTTFSLNVIVSEELIRLFLSFGGEVEIIEPESLRNQIIKRVEEMQLKYNI
jgi:predicted DNA-binding transcriptional regulator YafY